MQAYKVSPVVETPDQAHESLLQDEDDLNRFEEKKRPAIINFICSIRLAVIAIVIFLCLCIGALSVSWGTVAGTMVNDVTEVMR
jgi:hypothetical protein